MRVAEAMRAKPAGVRRRRPHRHDELAAILPGARQEVADTVAAALVGAVRAASGGRVGASCGGVTYGPETDAALDELLAVAERKMYAATILARDR
jgi:hypothetical protein